MVDKLRNEFDSETDTVMIRFMPELREAEKVFDKVSFTKLEEVGNTPIIKLYSEAKKTLAVFKLMDIFEIVVEEDLNDGEH